MLSDLMMALAAAVTTALLTIVIQHWLHRISDSVTLLNEQVQHYERVEALAISYWSVEATNEGAGGECARSKLLGAIEASGLFLDDARRLLGMRYQEYEGLDDQVFEIVTGGDFLSSNRQADPQRVLEIIVVCSKQRILLRRARRGLLGVR